jgi:nitrite reductase (NO-forming)
MGVRTSLLWATALVSLYAMLALPAFADGTHQHPAENGTAESPLDIVRGPTDLPPPLVGRGPETVRISLETVEVTGQLANGATYHYWTYGKKVPGPFVRVRVGDTVEVTLTNRSDSSERHSIDLHAVTGPGGGGVATDVAPGETRQFSFKALKAGLYVYHCAVPMAAQHVANGMYGLILVEPEGGLPKVDREFYVMQGEVYTDEPYGSTGQLKESVAKLMDEQPEYFVFNGAAEALTGGNALTAEVGETVRIYFGVGGPSKTSSFHVIGEIFDRAYQLASVASPPLLDVQTISVPPGGAAVVDLKLDVPGEFLLVDHALPRVARGLVGKLVVSGAADLAIFRAEGAANVGANEADAHAASDDGHPVH